MKNAWKGLAAVAVAAALVVAPLTMAGAAATNDGVCTGTHLSPTADGDLTVETYTAPEGQLISGYCVKAGSENQGLGPEYVTVNPPAASITFSHSSGKDISHFSVTLVEIPDEPPVQPEPIVTVVPVTTADCETDIATTVTTTTTTAYVWDEESWEWVLGEPVVTVATTTRPVTAEECPITPPNDIPVPALFNVEPTAPTCESAGTFNTAVFPIDREGYVLTVDRPFDGPGVYTITATAKPGFVIQGSISREVTVLGATGFQDDNPALPCYLAPPVVITLGQPTSVDECGTANDGASLPPAQEGVEYVWEDESDDENFNVLAIVEDGYVVSEASAGWAPGEGENVFVYAFDPTFSNAPCATGTTPPPAGTPAKSTTSLAATGAPDMTAWGFGAIAAMLGGLSLLGFRRFARR